MTQPLSSTNVEPITALLGARVAARRKASGLSQTQLGERVAVYGPDWSRTTVAKLESGGRKAVTVQELLALALVFDVPPVALLADPRESGPVPVAADIEVDQWSALTWLVGNGALGGRTGRSYGEFSNVIRAGNRILEAAWRLQLRERRGYARSPDGTIAHAEDGSLIIDEDEGQRLTDEQHRVALAEIRSTLLQLKAWGVPAPDLQGLVSQRAAELGVDLGLEG